MEAATDKDLPFQSEAGVFGSDDFLASLGIQSLLLVQYTLFNLISVGSIYPMLKQKLNDCGHVDKRVVN